MLDLVHALRRLVREPRFTLAAAGTLGVAVAACSLVLAFGWATLVQPTARFAEPERIVDVQATRTGGGEGSRHAVYPADFLAWREAPTTRTSFEAFGAYVPIGAEDLTHRPGGGEPVRLFVHRATAGLFPALGVPPARGRAFQPAEEEPGNDRVALLSDHLARRLGASPGDELVLGGEPHRVIGVMPPGFGVRGGFPDLWLPLSFGPHRPADRRSATLGVIGRLAPGVSIDAARAELSAVAAGLEERFPDTNEDLRPSLLPLVGVMTTGLRPTVRLLLGAVLAVLAVAAVNLSNLLLARAIARRGEMAVRASVGAGPARLARQSVLETAALSLLAALVGVALAAAVLPLLPDLHGRFLYRSIDLRLGAPVLALTALLALAAGALAGVVPALRARAARAAGSGRFGGAGRTAGASRSRRAARTTDLLVVGQVAVTLALLAGAGLMVRSLSERLSAHPGYTAERVVTFEVAPPAGRYPDAGSLARFDARLRSELEALPGVVAAASSDGVTGPGWGVSVWPDGPSEAPDGEPVHLAFRIITPGWLEALQIPLLSGRRIDERDHADAQPVVLLSRKAAEKLWGKPAKTDPIGRTVRVDEPDAEAHRIIGIMGDVAPAPGEAPAPTIYLAHAQHADLLDVVEQRARVFAVRASGGVDAAAISRVVAGLDPELPVSAFAPLTERLADLSFRPRLSTRILGGFALLALVLASVGLYSLLADAVGRRRREIGIRIALGAGKRQVVALLGRPTARLVVTGIATGALLAVLFVRWLASRVEGVLPQGPDGGLGTIGWTTALPPTAAALALLLLAVTLATAAPIRRALRTEPRDVLSE